MYKLTFRKLKEINEYDAMELLENNTYTGQRLFSKEHHKKLCGEIESGHFLVGDIALAVLEYDGKRKVLVNGQHQLSAVITTSIPVCVAYQEYSCPTPDDLSDLYRRFDNHRARSLSDIIIPEAEALNVDWKKVVVRLVVSAAALDNGQQSADKQVKVKYLGQYLRQGAFVDYILKDGISCSHMQRAPVVQAMMNTWDKEKQAAKGFWEAVRDGAGLAKNSPALVLRNYLLSTGLTKHRTARSEIATPRSMFVKCIRAWNAYRTDSTTTLKFFADAPLPKII